MTKEKLFLTFFGVGNLKPAPGTWGSIAGAIAGVFILKFAMAQTLFLLSIFIFLLSIKIIDKFEAQTNEHDNGFIVIDEVVGVWLAMYLSHNSWLAIILSVVFFRVYDILKPSVIGRVDKNIKGGMGVMLDDVLAGFFAGISSLIIIGAMIKFGFEKYIF